MELRLKHIKKLDRGVFKNTVSLFYSCRTAAGTEQKNFALKWQKLTSGNVTAYKGKTNYKFINSEFSGLAYYGKAILDKITGKETYRRYPQKSLNMPTGKEEKKYNQMIIGPQK